MSVPAKELTALVEEYAPVRLAEPWDRVGWQLGDPRSPVARIVLTLDVHREVVEESGAGDLIVAHHPLFFQPLSHVRLDEARGRLVAACLAKNIGVYAAHTNLDRAPAGVTAVLARELGLAGGVALGCQDAGGYLKLAVFVPVSHLEPVREALWAAGAGAVGAYDQCSFAVTGTGTFRPGPSTSPFLGQEGRLAEVAEARLETIVPFHRVAAVIEAMRRAHPYEEVAYDLYALQNDFARPGLGRLGSLPEAVPLAALARRVKSVVAADGVRYGGPQEMPVQKVAVAGGSGGSLWREARARGADVLVTGEVKYHEGQDMLAEGLAFVEAGHAATERVVLPALASFLKERCREKNWPVEVRLAGHQDEPFRYL